MSETGAPKLDINCPFSLVTRLTEVLDGIDDGGLRRVAAIHACARLIHATAFEMLPSSSPELAGEMIELAARLEKTLEAEHIAILDLYVPAQSVP